MSEESSLLSTREAAEIAGFSARHIQGTAIFIMPLHSKDILRLFRA